MLKTTYENLTQKDISSFGDCLWTLVTPDTVCTECTDISIYFTSIDSAVKQGIVNYISLKGVPCKSVEPFVVYAVNVVEPVELLSELSELVGSYDIVGRILAVLDEYRESKEYTRVTSRMLAAENDFINSILEEYEHTLSADYYRKCDVVLAEVTISDPMKWVEAFFPDLLTLFCEESTNFSVQPA